MNDWVILLCIFTYYVVSVCNRRHISKSTHIDNKDSVFWQKRRSTWAHDGSCSTSANMQVHLNERLASLQSYTFNNLLSHCGTWGLTDVCGSKPRLPSALPALCCKAFLCYGVFSPEQKTWYTPVWILLYSRGLAESIAALAQWPWGSSAFIFCSCFLVVGYILVLIPRDFFVWLFPYDRGMSCYILSSLW